MQPKKQIFGLDVAVYNVLLVAVEERPSEFVDVLRCNGLGERTFRDELLIQLSSRGVLKDNVYCERSVGFTGL